MGTVTMILCLLRALVLSRAGVAAEKMALG